MNNPETYVFSPCRKNLGWGLLGNILFLLLILVLLSDQAGADSISGIVEFSYNNFDTRVQGISGNTIRTTTNSLRQRYNLRLDKTIFPNLRLDAGGLFEKTASSTEIGGEDTESTSTRLNPFVDLRLNTPLYLAGVGYNRREDTSEVSGAPSVTLINENYSAIFGWRPESFPRMDMRFDRTNRYDRAHSFQDTVTDAYSMRWIYDAIEGLDLRYQPQYEKTSDRLNGGEIIRFIQNGRARYSSQFLNKRASLFTSYRISSTQTEIRSPGVVQVPLQIFPFAGLSSIDDTPTMGALNPNPALIDGNLTAAAGINLGLPSIGGETRPRNMGLDFFNQTEVNTLYVWVDRDLPSNISTSFSWEIYVSDDNQDWTLFQTVSPAPFGTFQNRFEINFSNVTTRYIKVVTRPLQPTVPGAANFPNIFVTELQAFIQRPVQGGSSEITSTSQNFELGARAVILKAPSLNYDFSYFLSTQDPSGMTRYTLSNGFSLSHRFNRILSGRARIGRDDIVEEADAVTYRYDASLTVTPLETLSHHLSYSGRIIKAADESSIQDSIFLRNTIELYKGVSINISGGLSLDRKDSGEKNESIILDLASLIVPHPTLTMNLNYTDTKSQQSGGPGPDSSNSSRRGVLSLSYTPFKTLFFLVSGEVLMDDDRTRTTQSYAFNWAPFPDGTLQFNMAYSESIRTGPDLKDRVIRPSLRWNITQKTTLDLSYQKNMGSSEFAETESDIFNTTLKINF